MKVYRVAYEDKNLYTKNKWFLRLDKAIGFYFMKMYQCTFPCIFEYNTISKITVNLSDHVENCIICELDFREGLPWK